MYIPLHLSSFAELSFVGNAEKQTAVFVASR
jgi:hypothetical protein